MTRCTGLCSEQLLQTLCTILRLGPESQRLTEPLQRKSPCHFLHHESLLFFGYFSLLLLYSLNNFHFYFHHYHLALLSSTSYITTFTLASGHLGLEIKISYCCILCVCAYSLSGIWLFATAWAEPALAPLSMGILQARILEWVFRSSFRDLPNPGIKLRFPSLQADSLPSELPGKSIVKSTQKHNHL